jgi:hypothetical protein
MKYICLLSLLLLHGCAVIDHLNTRSNRVEQVDAYLSEQEYSKALAIIADTPKNDPQAKQLNKKRYVILADLEKFEQQTITTALEQEQKKDWPGAKRTYEDALRKLNHSKILEAKQASMLRRFQDTMNILEFEKLIVSGESLKRRIPLERCLYENNPGDMTIQETYSRTQNEAAEVALKLLKAGESMLEKDNFALAQRLLPLAAELLPDPRTEAAVARLDRILKKKKSKKQKSKREIEQKQDKVAIEAFNRAMALGDLKESRLQLASLSPSIKKTSPVGLMVERLNKAIGIWVMEKISMGDAFYSAGEYEQAQKTWQEILDLLPDHEAVQRRSARTQTIIDKLGALEKRQSQGE